MLPLVEFPEIVQHYAPHFESVFSAEAYVQFQRYLSGLIVSENKTVDGDQSALCDREAQPEQPQPAVDGEPLFGEGFEPGSSRVAVQPTWHADKTQRCAERR